MDTDSHLIAPVYLLSSTIECYSCDEVTIVHCIAASGVSEEDEPEEVGVRLRLLSNVEQIDNAILPKLGEMAPAYHTNRSMTQGRRVWMNHCVHCGAKQGDFYLHSEPDGPFFAYEGGGHVVRELLLENGAFSFEADYSL